MKISLSTLVAECRRWNENYTATLFQYFFAC